jgi:hypothetical protein
MARRIALILKEVKYGETTKKKNEVQTSTPTKKRT